MRRAIPRRSTRRSNPPICQHTSLGRAEPAADAPTVVKTNSGAVLRAFRGSDLRAHARSDLRAHRSPQTNLQ